MDGDCERNDVSQPLGSPCSADGERDNVNSATRTIKQRYTKTACMSRTNDGLHHFDVP